MSGDWMLSQGTVEFRRAERDHANGRDRFERLAEVVDDTLAKMQADWLAEENRRQEAWIAAYDAGSRDFDAAAGVSPETEPAAAKEAR